MAERTLTYFVSDVHLGLDVNGPGEREARFVSFLRGIPADRTEALYMLGDIWDFWYEYRDVVPKGYARVFAALMDLRDAGVKLYFFQGNHDIWTFWYLQELGVKVLEQPYEVEIGGKVFCLGHGDGLGPGQRSYKLMRWAFHNHFIQRVFSMVHPYLAFRLGNGWSSRRRKKHLEAGEYVFKGEKEPLYVFASEYSRTRKVDYFIFGHLHTAVDITLPAGARLLVMKDWIGAQSSNWISFDSRSGCLGISRNME